MLTPMFVLEQKVLGFPWFYKAYQHDTDFAQKHAAYLKALTFMWVLSGKPPEFRQSLIQIGCSLI